MTNERYAALRAVVLQADIKALEQRLDELQSEFEAIKEPIT